MSAKLERQILGGFLAGILLLLIIALASVWLGFGVTSSQTLASRDQLIINTAQASLQDEVDAETGQRGYLITGDAKYLAPYQVGIVGAAASLSRLQALLPDTVENRADMLGLKSLLHTKLAEMAQTIGLRRQAGFNAAKSVVDSGIGYGALDQTRAIDRRICKTYALQLDRVIQGTATRLRWVLALLLTFGAGLSALLVWAYVHIFRELRRRREMAKDLERASSHDPLTQMPNRRFFYDWLTYALARAERDHSQAAVLFINLDSFKAVNSFFGYERGNKLLQMVATRLNAGARLGDVVARLGGDEFAVLIPVLSHPGEPAGVAQSLVESLALPFRENESLPTGASIGIAVYPADGETSELLFAAAEAAMRRAKSAGGNRYVFFFDADNSVQSRNLRIRADLFGCIEGDQLSVQYQPVVDAHGRILSLEALVRWDHPQLGRISPQDFIPLAEHSGAIGKIDRYVRQCVIRQAASWREAGILVPIAVNMSALEFSAAGLTDSMLQDLRQFDLPPRFMIVELVETALLKPESKATMQLLCDAGLSLVLDDFGTGYSSLTYLLHFPVTGVKIDRSFVMGLPDNLDSQRIVAVILQMAATLKLNVVAEGVETQAQRDWLVAQGCTRFQGYFFGRPMGAGAISDRLTAQMRAVA